MDTTYIPDHTYLSPFPPNYLSIGQSVYLSLYQSVCLSTHLTTCLDTPYCLHKDLCTSTKRDICFEMQHPSCKMWILLGMLGRLLDPSITLSLAISRSPSSLTASSTSTIVRNQEVWNRSQWQIYIYISAGIICYQASWNGAVQAHLSWPLGLLSLLLLLNVAAPIAKSKAQFNFKKPKYPKYPGCSINGATRGYGSMLNMDKY